MLAGWSSAGAAAWLAVQGDAAGMSICMYNDYPERMTFQLCTICMHRLPGIVREGCSLRAFRQHAVRPGDGGPRPRGQDAGGKPKAGCVRGVLPGPACGSLHAAGGHAGARISRAPPEASSGELRSLQLCRVILSIVCICVAWSPHCMSLYYWADSSICQPPNDACLAAAACTSATRTR